MPPTKTQLFIFISYVLFYKNDSTINYCIKNNKRMLNYNFQVQKVRFFYK